MPFGWVSAGLAIYNALDGGSSGGSSGGSGAPGATGYVPQWQSGADTNWQAILQWMQQQAMGDAIRVSPMASAALDKFQAGLPVMQDRMNHYGDTLDGQAYIDYNRGNTLASAGDTLWKTAADPEDALRTSMRQQTVDSSRAASSARGIGMGGESAGLESQATGNFDMNWQDRQLQRQIQAASGLTGAYDAAGRYGTAGNAALAGANSMYTGSYMLPYQGISAYTGAMSGIYNPLQAIGGDLAQYMGLGQSGGQNAFNQGQTNLNNLTSGLNWMGNNGGSSWLQNYFNPPPPDSSGSGASSTVDNTTWGGA